MAIGFILAIVVVVIAVMLYSYNSEKERVDTAIQRRIDNIAVKEKNDEVEVANHTATSTTNPISFEQALKAEQDRQDKKDEEARERRLEQQRQSEKWKRERIERQRKEGERIKAQQQVEQVRRERQRHDSGVIHNSTTHETATSFESAYDPTPSHSSSCGSISSSNSGSSSSYDGGSSSSYSSDSGSSSFSCD